MSIETYQAYDIKPDSNDYPREYRNSNSQIQFACQCHSGMIAGHANRTGLHDDEEGISRPVYQFQSFIHPELSYFLTYLNKEGNLVYIREYVRP